MMAGFANTFFPGRSPNKRGSSSPPETHRGKGSIPGAGPLASIVKVPRLEKEKNESVIQFKGMSPEKAKACQAGLALLELYQQQLAQQGSAQAGAPENASDSGGLSSVRRKAKSVGRSVSTRRRAGERLIIPDPPGLG